MGSGSRWTGPRVSRGVVVMSGPILRPGLWSGWWPSRTSLCPRYGAWPSGTGKDVSEGRLYSRLINGERGGYLGYAIWRRYLTLAHGYTAAHKDGPVKYTAHELRHVCASLLIASGATDTQVTAQMGHSKIETTKNIYGHRFAQDRAEILKAINAAVSRLYVQEGNSAEGQAA
jgi:integrase